MRTDSITWENVERKSSGCVTGLTTRVGRQLHRVPAYRVLTPVDGSPASLAALRVAADIAGRSTDTYLHVLNVQTADDNTGNDDNLMSAGLADTEVARRFLAGEGASYQLKLAAGNPVEVILAYVREQRITEIVMGSDGAGSVDCALLGSVALDVLDQTDLPVTFAKSRNHARQFAMGIGDLLVAYDGSAGSLRALHYALEHVSKLPNAPRIHLLNVHTTRDGLFSGRNDQTGLSERTPALAACDVALRALDAAGADFEFHVAHGDPVERIPQFAASIDCSRIVMYSRGLGWFAALMARSTSWGVLYRTAIPITLVE